MHSCVLCVCVRPCMIPYWSNVCLRKRCFSKWFRIPCEFGPGPHRPIWAKSNQYGPICTRLAENFGQPNVLAQDWKTPKWVGLTACRSEILVNEGYEVQVGVSSCGPTKEQYIRQTEVLCQRGPHGTILPIWPAQSTRNLLGIQFFLKQIITYLLCCPVRAKNPHKSI